MKNKSLRAGQRFSLLKRPPTPDDRSFSEGEKKKRLTRPVFFCFAEIIHWLTEVLLRQFALTAILSLRRQFRLDSKSLIRLRFFVPDLVTF